MPGYNDSLDPDQQITMEERISSYLFAEYRYGFKEEEANEAAKRILLMILEEFRPDLIAK